MVQKTEKTGEREEGYKVIDRAAFRDWLNARGEPPSVHIQAWIRALDSAPAAITKAKGQAAVVKCFLQECVTRAQRLGFEFDLNNMPGQKEQFLELIKRMEPSFRKMKSIGSLDRYLKGQCKWSLTAAANSDATTFYQKLFPEAWGNPGAVSENRKKV